MSAVSRREPRAAVVVEAIRTAARAVEADAEAVAETVARELHADIRELGGDERSRLATKRAAADTVVSFMRTLVRGAPAQATELPETPVRFARAMARAGHGTQPLIRVIYVTLRAVLAAWEQQLAELELTSDVILAAVQACQKVSFEWADDATARLIAEYQDEHDRLSRTGEVERARTIRALLDGDPPNPDALSRALGYELGRHHTALVLWAGSGNADSSAALDRAAADVATALRAGRPLILPVSRAVIWAWVATPGPPEAELAALPRQRSDEVSIAIGEPAFGSSGFRDSHRDADDAYRLAQLSRRRPGSVIPYDDVRLAAMLASDLQRARRFVHAELGALATDDDEHLRLRATLKVFLDEHASRQATAERLGIHANTVGNRIRTCQELLGDRDPRRQLELHVALALAERLGPGVLG